MSFLDHHASCKACSSNVRNWNNAARRVMQLADFIDIQSFLTFHIVTNSSKQSYQNLDECQG